MKTFAVIHNGVRALARGWFPDRFPWYPWSEPTPEFFKHLRRTTRKMLMAAGQKRGRHELESNMVAAEPKNENTWANALMVLGLATSARLGRDAEDLSVLVRFFDSLIDESGRFRQPLTSVDHCMIGYSALEMGELTDVAKFRNAAEEVARFLLHEHPKTANGTLPYNLQFRDVLFPDTLGMVCPFLARYGAASGERSATGLAVRQLREFLAKGREDNSGLFFHACHSTLDERYGLLGWTRGAGWLCLGLADTLVHLSTSDSAWADLASALSSLVRVISAYQEPEGCWRWALNVPGARLDTSGTAMLGYAIMRAIDGGALDPATSGIAKAALAGIARHTNLPGMVSESLADCGWIGDHPQRYGRTPWAQGATTALAALFLAGKT